MTTGRYSRRHLLGLGAAGAIWPMTRGAAETLALELKMVTSWPKNSPGPGQTAERLARRIAEISGGRIRVRVYAAGELVSALEVLDAVGGGAADLGHTASFFWQGKMPAAAFFTAVPFGLTASEHMAWVHHGGGQALWDALYKPFGVKPFMAGNTGIGMGGWFKKPIDGPEDLRGLKYRMPGLGGEVFKALGAVPVSVSPGDIYTALQTGVVDGAEFLGPWSDLAFGLYKIAPYYYWPGFHEPNGTGECLVNLARWETLPAEARFVIESACAAENAFALSETEWRNAGALNQLVDQHAVQVRAFPEPVLTAARRAAAAVVGRFAEGSAIEQEIYRSYGVARRRALAWADVSTRAYLNARAGAEWNRL